jgi:hypothetical protein
VLNLFYLVYKITIFLKINTYKYARLARETKTHKTENFRID